MIRCNNCRTENIDGSEYCDECGMKLDAGLPPMSYKHDGVERPVYQPPSAVQNDNDHATSNTIEGATPVPPSFTTSTSIPKPAMPARESERTESSSGDGKRGSGPHVPRARREEIEDPAVPQGPAKTYVLSSRGRTEGLNSEASASEVEANPRITAKLVIERGGRIGREFSITGIETNIGRWDADSGIFPDVDLDEDDPEAKISRRHARIINHNGQYFIEDLGSTNGTFVNRGRRLLPGKRHMLQSGDEVIVGKTFLKFHILR